MSSEARETVESDLHAARFIREYDLLEQVDFLRLDAARRLDEDRQAKLGQFFTPAPVVRLMVGMVEAHASSLSILDPGAGVGSLFSGCVAELCARAAPPRQIQVTAYEMDPELAAYARTALDLCESACKRKGIVFSGEVVCADFIRAAVERLEPNLFGGAEGAAFDLAVLNPPYHKIHTHSEYRALLRRIGVETSNIYTGFLAATIQLLAAGGELVAITPRSFCNGPYFRPFREALLGTTRLRRIHVFESREEAFREAKVLQENVIFHAVKGAKDAPSVTITSSAGPEDDLVMVREVPYEEVVRPGDRQSFIHIVPDDLGQEIAARVGTLQCSLEELGITVSTGRVVDFRAREFLRAKPGTDTAPLIYPAHFKEGFISWPNGETRKSNALLVAPRTDELLVPNGNYVLVRRFSTKEEKRRVVAAVHDGGRVPGSRVGFENHLNYFHQKGRGLDLTLAKGLAAYLNSTLVDLYFRQFNGHTQVNATDLRSLKYPTQAELEALGERIGEDFPDQHELDRLVGEELEPMTEGNRDLAAVQRRIEEAQTILRALGLPKQQTNERSALTLLSLLDITPEKLWPEAGSPLRGITPMMEFFAQHYGKRYAPNTRETVRRQTVHQFLDAGLILANPDEPERPINSGKNVYQIEQGALEVIRTYGTSDWTHNLRTYLTSVETLKQKYAQEREMVRIPVRIAPEKLVTLSPGGQNILVKVIIDEFGPRFTPDGNVIYLGDTDEKFAHFDRAALAALGVEVDEHGKMPDVIIHHTKRNWMVLIEAVTSHGPVNAKRRAELVQLFRHAKVGLVFVTAFLTRRAMVEYLDEISWETEVWVAESPSHLIHFNGERFLGPYDVS